MMIRPVSEVWAEQQEMMSRRPLLARSDLPPPPTGTSFSLLPHLNYDPAERNQVSCGNCWMWTGTAEAEIALYVRYGIFNRLSIQFFSQCQSQTACCGIPGNDNVFNAFYNDRKMFVPWANTNAEWRNGSGYCHPPCSDIDTSFNYPITSIRHDWIETIGQPQAQAIANIKSVLNQNKAVLFGFTLPTNAMSDFDDFWLNQSEQTRWNPDLYPKAVLATNLLAGHAVVCVGYDYTDPANAYWLMVNSWGNPGLRNNGLFRVKMDVDYSAYSVYDDGANKTYTYQMQWSCSDVTFDDPEHWDDIYESQYGNDTRTSATEFSYHWAGTWDGKATTVAEISGSLKKASQLRKVAAACPGSPYLSPGDGDTYHALVWMDAGYNKVYAISYTLYQSPKSTGVTAKRLDVWVNPPEAASIYK